MVYLGRDKPAHGDLDLPWRALVHSSTHSCVPPSNITEGGTPHLATEPGYFFFRTWTLLQCRAYEELRLQNSEYTNELVSSICFIFVNKLQNRRSKLTFYKHGCRPIPHFNARSNATRRQTRTTKPRPTTKMMTTMAMMTMKMAIMMTTTAMMMTTTAMMTMTMAMMMTKMAIMMPTTTKTGTRCNVKRMSCHGDDVTRITGNAPV